MQPDPMTTATLLYLLKATAVLLLTLGIALLLRRAPAGTRHLAWLSAVVVVLAIPVLAPALPQLRIVPIPSAADFSAAGAWNATTTDGSVVRTPLVSEASGSGSPSGLALPSGTTRVDAQPAGGVPSLSSRLSGRAGETSWGWILFLVWIGGALIVFARLALSTMALRGILRSAEPLSGQDWLNPLYEAADRLDLKEVPRLVRSDRVAMPFACGLLSPTIVVPTGAEEWPAPRRRAVLFHELAHIRRRDLVGHALGRIACALYWMHPLVWAAAYRLRAESERACDDLVLSTGTPASEYADHLLQILVGVRANDAPAVALPMGRRREFEGRLLAILDPALRRHRPTTGHALLLVVFSLTAAGLVALAPRDASGTSLAGVADTEVGTDAGEHQLPFVDHARSTDEAIRSGEPSRGLPAEPGGSAFSAPAPMPARSVEPHSAGAPHLDRIVEDFATNLGNEFGAVVGSAVGSGLQVLFGGASSQAKDIPLLVRLLATDPSAEVRRTAAWGLYDTGDERATTALVRAAAADESAEVREMAVWALHRATGEEVRTALAAATEDADPGVRSRAVWGLGHSGVADASVLSILAGRLADPDEEVRLRAAWAIGHLGPEAAPTPLYQRALADASSEVRVAAGWALGQIADPVAQPALDRALQSERDPEALRAVVYALHRLGPLDPAAVESLLASEDDDVRTQAIRILAGAAAEFDPWPWPWPEPRPFP